ncbi:MAG: pyridoxal phosphate-dependent aminotransferase [Gammaproteobacteria bacterium]|nr:pyridoxal phosphate-dependent aminotransferase [Gammaproteobacteria bacterium]
MQDPVARRMREIEPFHVMKLLARARELEAQGRDIVHMEIGEPDFPSPPQVLQAGIRALESGYTHYTPALGLMALREAIADYYRQHYKIEFDARRVVVTPGSSGALQLLFGTLVNPGDSVLLTDPGYPCNRHFVRLFEGRAINIPVDANQNFQPRPEDIHRYADQHTRGLLVASPANPTGTVLSAESIRELAATLKQHDGYLIVDEIYHGLEYTDERLPTALHYGENVFVINSFSKFFGMTGWRLGWMVVPEEFIEPIDKLAQNIFLAASTPAQHAALACFTPETMEELERRRMEFQHRRDFLLPALERLGFKIKSVPTGAFYIYCDCSAFTQDSFLWCNELLEQAGVAITPGIDFGTHLANTHVRFAYTTSIERLEEGMKRLEAYLQH